MSNILLRLENVSKVYGEKSGRTVALDNINLEIGEGEFIGIIGTSGSGKTTLLNILGCMERMSDGHYYVLGKDVESLSSLEQAHIRNQTFGFVMQDYALIEHYTVYENIELPLKYAKHRIKNKKESINQLLESLDIDIKAQQLTNTLSGGQKQRVAIARALVNDAKIILADEPTGALDTKNGKQVMDLLSKLNQQGKTIILVTHNMDILSSCTRVISLEDGKIASDNRMSQNV